MGAKIALLFVAIVVLGSCKSAVVPTFSAQQQPLSPNYGNVETWAILPDSYPENLKHWQTNTTGLDADIFYIYPTLNIEKKDLRWNVPVTDSIQNIKVIDKAVYFQASAFLNTGKLYVPYYRQAHLRSYTKYENGGKEALSLAYSDVKEAFKTYLEKYNNGRPIIIASHSQGTTHAIRLLKEFFDGKPLQNKLVAAYLPGIAIKKNEFQHIKMMTNPAQTGGFVSWNTFKKRHYPKTYKEWFKGAEVSNPVDWDGSKESELSDHKGFLFTNDKIYKQALKVYVKDGILWISLPHFPYRLLVLGKKRYHAGDINLFWEDIRENASLRVESYLKKQMISENKN
ncbi:MAG: hypothetical protein A3F91_14070 [Flavobacteria bacterium RIFCSPLOWO2_12_FULL_35_11]|nr:MAG: hypothetical protein A3F91_14070 [Flavobacteria bacterium RIFCSPLOWO2_12_FULL_35_11]